jgi:hypothetical protein
MAISVPSGKFTSEHSRPAVRTIPPFPKASAIRGLAKKLEGSGFDSSSALSLAQAAVDPTDVRRRLEWPAPIRVPGATLWTIEADVWTPAIAPYVGNYREAASRSFPTDETSDSASRRPIRRPKGDPAGRPVLDLEVDDRAALVQALEGSVNYLVEHNNLSDSISEKGVMVPITIAMSRVKLDEDDDSVPLPATVDGSSRTSGAMDVLELSAEDLIDVYGGDPRALSGLVGRVRALASRPLDEVSPEELGKTNALILPARIIVGFEPDSAGRADFAKAVHTFVQLIHGDLPPATWSDTAKVDSKADSVLSELEQANLLTLNRALYMEGMLTPMEARTLSLPETADERGLFIVSVLSDPKESVHSAIRAGVVQPSEKKKVTKWVKAEIAAELALRGARGILPPKEVKKAREVLANVYSSPLIWEQDLRPSGKSSEDLLEEALAEHREGAEGPASAELAALGGFWLVVQRVLRDPRFFKEENFRDGRVPSTVITALVDSEWGLTILAKALADGRKGKKIEKVDREGEPLVGVSGTAVQADHAWLRGIVVPPRNSAAEAKKAVDDHVDDLPPLPDRVILTRRKAFEGSVESLEGSLRDLESVTGGDGDPLVEKQGLPVTFTEDLRERIDSVSRTLVIYGARWADADDTAGSETIGS